MCILFFLNFIKILLKILILLLKIRVYKAQFLLAFQTDVESKIFTLFFISIVIYYI